MVELKQALLAMLDLSIPSLIPRPQEKQPGNFPQFSWFETVTAFFQALATSITTEATLWANQRARKNTVLPLPESWQYQSNFRILSL